MFVQASPEVVFDVLSDPWSYGDWVVGSREVRAADADWPARGTTFDHAVGTGPLRLKDHTQVEAMRRPSYLRLVARARPLPAACVTLNLEPEDGGTRVTMVEDLAVVFGSLLMRPLGHLALRVRNAESLRRLKRLVEAGA
jgi:hypothetical protein